MNDTNDIVRSNSPDSSKRERGMNRIWASLHPRHVIWVLFLGLITVLGWNGTGYIDRLKAVETHIEKQNGTLVEIQLEQQTQKVNMEWVVKSMGGEPAVTKPK